MKMESDLNRFRKIVRGRIKKELRKYIASGDLIGRQGKKSITIPVPRIDLPRFTFGSSKQSGVGQGDGQVGDEYSKEQGQEGEGQAGDQEGQHTLEVDVTLEDLAGMLGEELELPHIENKGKKISKISRSNTPASCAKVLNPSTISEGLTEKHSGAPSQQGNTTSKIRSLC